MEKTYNIGVLTAGGDCPGLNAAIRGIGKAALHTGNAHVIGFLDGFRGLAKNRMIRLDEENLSGILTVGGTVLGTSRDKPHRMMVGGKAIDMTDAMVEIYNQHHLDALVCLGGGGTQKNAYRLHQKGLNIITLPKTIDNDVGKTDVTFGFDTALGIATEAIDRLHSTAHSHHRIIVVEIMGHNAGWLALGAGVAGGADVILIPEIPYDVQKISEGIRQRSRSGKRFSIVAVAEGAMDIELASKVMPLRNQKVNGENKAERQEAKAQLLELEKEFQDHTLHLSHQLEELTNLEARVTILGHLLRGGTPSSADRLLATRLGTACMDLIQNETFGVMVSARGEGFEAIPLKDVVGQKKLVPLDHPWVQSARNVGTIFGD